jgi:methylthioribose-1-phosphate isomerase
MTAAFGLYLAMLADSSDQAVQAAYRLLIATRPPAVNLQWALDRMESTLLATAAKNQVQVAKLTASEVSDDDVKLNESIGNHGLELLETLSRGNNVTNPLRILPHYNAGWQPSIGEPLWLQYTKLTMPACRFMFMSMNRDPETRGRV